MTANFRPPSASPAPHNVIRIVSAARDLPVEQLLHGGRTSAVVEARQLAMYLARKVSRRSLKELGAAFDRDHGTVLHACKSYQRRLKDEPALRAEAIRLEAALLECDPVCALPPMPVP